MTKEETLKKALEIIDKQKSNEVVAAAIREAASMIAELQANLSEENRVSFAKALSRINFQIPTASLEKVLKEIHDELQKPCDVTITLELN